MRNKGAQLISGSPQTYSESFQTLEPSAHLIKSRAKEAPVTIFIFSWVLMTSKCFQVMCNKIFVMAQFQEGRQKVLFHFYQVGFARQGSTGEKV